MPSSKPSSPRLRNLKRLTSPSLNSDIKVDLDGWMGYLSWGYMGDIDIWMGYIDIWMDGWMIL